MVFFKVILLAFLDAIYAGQIFTVGSNEDWNYDNGGTDWDFTHCNF
jgi:carbonic anhydrase